jgi:dihydrofolate reductase
MRVQEEQDRRSFFLSKGVYCFHWQYANKISSPQKENIIRKVIMLNRVSIDGFFAGPNGEIYDWFINDPEVDKAAHEMAQADTILFGRVTYQLFESVWPNVAVDPNAPKEARIIANEVNEMTKVVFSKTLKEVTWENSKLFNGNLSEEVKTRKWSRHDEYLFVLTPVVLGAGKPLFKDVKKFNLEFLEARDFNSGNVLLHYKTDR